MSQDPYSYGALPPGDTFRYLVLEPGTVEDPLRCDLHIGFIADVRYETISYVWGNPERNQTIACGAHFVTITTSLSVVLRRIRSAQKAYVLWADGVCIDQQNLQEKGHQVALMAKIYRGAERVLIYVEPDDKGQGPALCALIEEADRTIQQGCEAIDMSWDSFPYPDDDDPLLTDPRWGALHSLLSQNWFDRGWVVQEAASAPKGQVIWGESEFDWDKLMRVHTWLSTRALGTYNSFLFSEVLINAHKNIYLDTHEEFGRAFYDKMSWGTSSILQTLNNAKELDLSNPQDRIYAFIELPQHLDHPIRVRPNYYSTHLETYRQFAVQYVRSTKSTELLDYVHHDETSPFSIPSWIPRWDISTWSLGQSSIASSVASSRSGLSPKPSLIDDGSLQVQGVIIDTLEYLSDAFEWHTATSQAFVDIWNQISDSGVPCPYDAPLIPHFSHRLGVFFASLSAGAYDGDFVEWQRAKKDFAGYAYLKAPKELEDGKSLAEDLNAIQLVEETAAGDEMPSNMFFDFIRNRTHNRRFALTKRGYMGLAPAPACLDDRIAIIFGCKTPCVLRKATREQVRGNYNHEKYYTYIGATSLVGKEWCVTEDGEAMFCNVLGEDDSKDWVEWDVEEQVISLC